MLIVPQRGGKLFAPCPDMFSPSYRNHAAHTAGEFATRAEERIYLHLLHTHIFTPIAIETLGVIDPRSLAFLKDLGRRIRDQTGEKKSTSFLLQWLSVAV